MPANADGTDGVNSVEETEWQKGILYDSAKEL